MERVYLLDMINILTSLPSLQYLAMIDMIYFDKNGWRISQIMLQLLEIYAHHPNHGALCLQVSAFFLKIKKLRKIAH